MPDDHVIESKTKNSGSGPKKTLSPIPVVFKYFSARSAIVRGSRSYPFPSVGSTTLQVNINVGSSIKGSRLAVFGSGNKSISEALIPFHPATDEPSNACPSLNLSKLKAETGTETCCSLPLVSVKRKSTNVTFLSLIIFITLAAVAIQNSLRLKF